MLDQKRSKSVENFDPFQAFSFLKTGFEFGDGPPCIDRIPPLSGPDPFLPNKKTISTLS